MGTTAGPYHCNYCRAIPLPLLQGHTTATTAGPYHCHYCRAIPLPLLQGHTTATTAGPYHCHYCRAISLPLLQVPTLGCHREVSNTISRILGVPEFFPSLTLFSDIA